MNIGVFKARLLDDLDWWQALERHVEVGDCFDEETVSALQLAKNKIRIIEQMLRRIEAGDFGRCTKCGTWIEEERLWTLLTCDCFVCSQCARGVTTVHDSQTRALSSARQTRHAESTGKMQAAVHGTVAQKAYAFS